MHNTVLDTASDDVATVTLSKSQVQLGLGSTLHASKAAGFGLTRELVEKANVRIQTILWLVFGATLLSLSVRTLRAIQSSEAFQTEKVGLAYVSVALAIAVGGLVSTRLKRDSLLYALKYGIALEVSVGFVISVGNTLHTAMKFGHAPFLTWTTPLIIIFPLIVPTPPKLTLRLALGTALSAPLAILVSAQLGALDASLATYLESLISPVIAVSVAYYGSGVVHQLNVDYAKARRMGVYELTTRIGQGGMGQVWAAKHELLSRPAAIKVINPSQLGRNSESTNSVFARFEQEAQATAQLRSPHTIEVYDFGVASDGSFYYVMELLDGLNLERFVKKHGPFSGERAHCVLSQVAESLDEAHQTGLIHRDVKPANIHLCQFGLESDFVKVLDFGLVKANRAVPGAEKNQTADHVFQGSPGFMSPEQILAEEEVTAGADIYAWGCVAYWLLTGKPVFPAPNAVEVMARHLSMEVPDVRGLSESPVSWEFAKLIESCLAKKPEHRPSSMAEVRRQLADLEEDGKWTRGDANDWWAAHMPEIFSQRNTISLSPGADTQSS